MEEPPAKALWETALGQLQVQVTRPNYETWLRDTVGLGNHNGTFTIGVPSDFAAEWLNTRLRGLIAKTVSGIAGRPVQVAFQVVGVAGPAAPSPPPAGPLFPSAPSSPASRARLNRLFTFHTFTVADCNRLAHAAAIAVTEKPGDSTHNPLFLHGDSGLGKTHLLHAIAHELLRSDVNVLYTTAEQFTSEFVQSARQRRMDEFRAKYRCPDALLIDDVQFFAGKEQTQEEFFHTFNDLHTAARQIVITSDQPPQGLARFSGRLRSRLHWGLAADLACPPYEARLAILTAKAHTLRGDIVPLALEFLARQPAASIRELEGSLNRVLAYARLTQQQVTLPLARDALHAPDQPATTAVPLPEDIIEAVCLHFDVSRQALRSKARTKRVATARHMAMYLLRHDSYQPLASIGRLLGDRDHSTVLYACRKIEREATVIPETTIDINSIRRRLAAG